MAGYRFYKSKSVELICINNRIIRFGEHCHSSDFVITAVTNGCALLRKGNLVQRINSNEFFTVAPYEPHSLTSENPVSLLTLCISKHAVFNLNKCIFETLIENSLSALVKQGTLVENFAKVFHDHAIEVYEKYHGVSHTENGIYEISRSSIEKNPETEKSINQLADEIFTSKYHYIRKFKETAGLTPHKFQIQNKIRKSQRLLLEGFSVSYAAQSVGFYDQSHFDKYFKKHVGISPSEYVDSISNFLQAEK